MKKKDFLQEIKALPAEELKTRASGIAEELMRLRFRKASRQYEQNHRIRQLKRNLARIQTALSTQSGAQ